MKEPRKARTPKDLEERLLEKKGAEDLSEEEEDSELERFADEVI